MRVPYQSAGVMRIAGVVPSQLGFRSITRPNIPSLGKEIPPDLGFFGCPEYVKKCMNRCTLLVGRDKSRCMTTCREAPVCGNFSTSLGPGFTWTCTQRCCRTHEFTSPRETRSYCCTRPCFQSPGGVFDPRGVVIRSRF